MKMKFLHTKGIQVFQKLMDYHRHYQMNDLNNIYSALYWTDITLLEQ